MDHLTSPVRKEGWSEVSEDGVARSTWYAPVRVLPAWLTRWILAVVRFFLHGQVSAHALVHRRCVRMSRLAGPGQPTLLRGRIRGVACGPERQALVACARVRTRVQGVQVDKYVQDACDFDLVTEGGRVVHVRGSGLHMVARSPVVERQLDGEIAEWLGASAPPADGLSRTVAMQAVVAGAEVELFGVLCPKVDPQGSVTLEPTAEGLLLFPLARPVELPRTGVGGHQRFATARISL
jgi:hypothetical protein